MQHISKVKAIKRSHANKLGPVERERERERGRCGDSLIKATAFQTYVGQKKEKVKPYKFVQKLGQAKPTKSRLQHITRLARIVVNMIKF